MNRIILILTLIVLNMVIMQDFDKIKFPYCKKTIQKKETIDKWFLFKERKRYFQKQYV